jgi:hypothetical protein
MVSGLVAIARVSPSESALRFYQSAMISPFIPGWKVHYLGSDAII